MHDDDNHSNDARRILIAEGLRWFLILTGIGLMFGLSNIRITYTPPPVEATDPEPTTKDN